MKNKYLLVGYYPLLDNAALGFTPGQLHYDISAVSKKLDNLTDLKVHGIMWASGKHGAMPILIVDEKANEIAEHLNRWSEEDPSWFKMHLEMRGDQYVFVLMPDIERSIKRFKMARLSCHEEFVTSNDFVVLYSPLQCWCPNNASFVKIKDLIPKQCIVGLIDINSFDRNNPQCVDFNLVATIGPFEYCDPNDTAKNHIEYLFETYEE